MPDVAGHPIGDYLWRFEVRKNWHSFTVDQAALINECVRLRKFTVKFNEGNENESLIDLRRMVLVKLPKGYERRIRCIFYNSGFHCWLSIDEYGMGNCLNPAVTFQLEKAFHNNTDKKRFNDGLYDYEFDLRNLTLTNCTIMETLSVKRESVSEMMRSEDIKSFIAKNENFVAKLSAETDAENTDDAPSVKRARLDPDEARNDSLGVLCLENNGGDRADNDSAKAEGQESFPVDEFCPVRESHHLYCKKNVIYSATLNQTNVQRNNNKFYIIQLLEKNDSSKFALYRRWGRVGNTGQTEVVRYQDLAEAKKSFEQKFYDKTRNQWNNLKNFEHVSGKYDVVNVELLKVAKKVKSSISEVQSQLPETILNLLELICDKSRMEEIMSEMNYDSKKTPLGQLTRKQVSEGFLALRKIAEYLSSGKKRTPDLIDLCNAFYTKIPHSFGMKTPPLILSLDEVKNKMKMLEALMNITVAMDVMQSSSSVPKHPLDQYYHSLNCSLENIPPESELFVELAACLKGTHGPTHTLYDMDIVNAFHCVKNETEPTHKESLNSDDKLLLWHGSRITNWVGILKEGLRVAPPEAPVQGYMFGKGIYFADVSSKSANYCFANKKKNYGILLLCEVSIGNQHLLQNAAETLPIGLPNNMDSVLGQGRVRPSGFKTGPLSPEAKVPHGPLQCDDSYDGSLHYNEYVVYSVKQVKMKYLLRIRFNFH